MMTTILMRRKHQVFFVIFINYSFNKNYYCHIAVKKDFPLDFKIKRENKGTEDDISVVASDVKERSQPSFLNTGRSGILPFVSIIKHEKGNLVNKLYFFNGIQEFTFLNIILGENVLQSDDDVVALPAPKPKPRTNKKNVWDGVAPKFS